MIFHDDLELDMLTFVEGGKARPLDCTNPSCPPPCGWMNPYPLVGLNHFTVPVAIPFLRTSNDRLRPTQHFLDFNKPA